MRLKSRTVGGREPIYDEAARVTAPTLAEFPHVSVLDALEWQAHHGCSRSAELWRVLRGLGVEPRP